MCKRFLIAMLTLLLLLTAVTAQAQELTQPEQTQTEEAELREQEITSLEAFLSFAENCRLDSYSVGLTVYLQADIDLSGANFAGIPTFSGIFEGGGHTISGLEVTADGSVQGLFRYLTETAAVRDLTVEGSVTPQGSRAFVGGIVGENAGLMENCVFSGTVSGGDRVGGLVGINTATGEIYKCRAEGTVQGSHFVGGIAGENAGMLRRCENDAKVNTTAQQNSVDISDITMDTITDSEFAGTVTDIGGIAGSSSGTIRRCVNRADVGYKHMGYNIGGITGSQTGYTTGCTNYGNISGRKDVGGIVGQLEPSVLLSYEADTLQLLKAELEQLSELTDRAVMNAQSNTNTVRSLMQVLENYISDARAAADSLAVDPEDPTFQNWETVTQALETIQSSVAGAANTLRSLTGALDTTAQDLERDLQAVADQMKAVEATLENSTETLGGTLTDVSDEDDRNTLTSKVENCENQGPVLADMNTGGIAGAVALENDLDPEEDVALDGDLSLNVSGQIRAVILSCDNSAAVTLRRQNAGGIVGWQSLGLVRKCVNTGLIDGENADYVGGIVGMSQGAVRQCSARCAVSGDAYTGGIAGSGRTVTDCRSVVTVSAREKQGAVLGEAEDRDGEETVSGNCYVPVRTELAAIDGIDYDGAAQPVELQTFLKLPDLDKVFRSVTVRFIAEDGTEQVITVKPGESVPNRKIPAVAEKVGYTGRWGGLQEDTLKNIVFDLTFHAVYTAHDTTVQSDLTREERPVLLVQGDFTGDGAVSVKPYDGAPALTEKETLLESWQLTVTGCETVTAGRLLVPGDTDISNLCLYVRDGAGRWQLRTCGVSGSYLVFDLAAEDSALALTLRQEQPLWPLILGAGAGVVALVTVTGILFLRRRRKKKQPAAAEE